MILYKKALRSIWANKKAYIACIVLITIGIFIFVIMGILNMIFSEARDVYYHKYRLADVFSKVSAISKSSVEDLRRIDGVDDVSGRFVYDARVLIPNSDKIITLRINSIDSYYDGIPINGVMMKGGSFGEYTDIAVGSDFLSAHNLKIGDVISVIIEGREYRLNICAVAESPEYVYAIKDIMDILPDPEAFGFAYMSEEGLWALTNSYGVYNDISFILSEEFTYESVKASLEDNLNKYGLTSLYPQKDHISVSMVDSELSSIASMSTSIPFVFLSMSVIVLYLMLKRVIEQERTQIGVLKAFGYSNTKIVIHYIMYGAVTGIIGGVLGSILAVAASGPYIDLFKTYFKLPTENIGIPIFLLLQGTAISLISGVLGGYFGSHAALKLIPAEAMRPSSPKIRKSNIIKKLPFLQLLLTSSGSMAIRNIERNKVRSSVVILGVVFAFGLMGFMGSYGVMIDFIIYNQFTKVQRYDAKIIFKTPQDRGQAIESAYKIPKITLVEALLEIPVELKHKNLKSGISLTGIEEDSKSYFIYDNDKGYSHEVPKDGIIISDALSKKLNATGGDILYLSSNLMEDDIKVIVTGVVEQNIGSNAYMEIDAVSKMFNTTNAATSLIIKTDDISILKNFLNEASNVAAIEDKVATLKNYTDMMQPYSTLIYIMWFMAVVVAFSIIYNISTISLSERQREYATLRVMGMHVSEVGAIMAFEYWILCFIGILFGTLFLGVLKQALSATFEMDAFTFPTFTPISAYIEAIIGCITAVFFANRSALKQIKKFDMVEVLKERE